MAAYDPGRLSVWVSLERPLAHRALGGALPERKVRSSWARHSHVPSLCPLQNHTLEIEKPRRDLPGIRQPAEGLMLAVVQLTGNNRIEAGQSQYQFEGLAIINERVAPIAYKIVQEKRIRDLRSLRYPRFDRPVSVAFFQHPPVRRHDAR